MKRLLAIAALGGLAAAGAMAQTPAAPPAASQAQTPGFGGNGPIDITSDSMEVMQPQHLTIFQGNVEAVQNQARLRTPQLRIFSKEKPGAPGQAPATGTQSFGSIERMEAQGPVYYITPTETARGDYGIYEAAPDTISLIGNVVLVQENKNVAKGDKLVINRKTGQTNLIANNAARAPGRIRVIIYPSQQQTGQGGAAAKPAPAPAKGRS